jgi:hypothetical protein
LIGLALVLALGGLVGAKTYAPDYQNYVAVGFIVSLAGIIAGYWIREYVEATGPLHLNCVVVGQELEEDLFYVKSTSPRESRPLEGLCSNSDCDYEWNPRKGQITECPECHNPIRFIRFETEVNLVEPKEFPDLFPEAGEAYFVYIRHWLTWEERVKAHGGVALKGGIPYWVNHSETVMLKPLLAIPFLPAGREYHQTHPTFEMLFTVGGDASRDLEFINLGFRSAIKKQLKGEKEALKAQSAASPAVVVQPITEGGQQN